MHVDAGLVEMTDPGAGGVGDRGGLRDTDPEGPTAGAGMAGSDADEDTDRAGAHEVQRGRVGSAATNDDREVELADELLQVEGLARFVLRDMLGRHDGALDDKQVELGVEDVLGVLLHPLGGERRARGHTTFFDLADAGPDQVVSDRLGVDLLHAPGGLLGGKLGDLLEERFRVLVAGPETFEVEAGQTSEAVSYTHLRA